MNHWVDWTIVVLSIIAVLVSVGLLAFSRRNLPTVSLAGWLFLWGLLGWWNGPGREWFNIGEEQARIFLLVLWSVQGLAMITFALVYPNLVLGRVRKAVLLSFTTAVIVYLVVLFGWDWSPQTHSKMFFFFVVVPNSLAFGLLAYRWITARTPTYRMQTLWAVLPFFFWALHDGLEWSLYRIARIGVLPVLSELVEQGPGISAWFLISHLAVLIAFGIWAHAGWRLVQGKADESQRVLALITPFLIAVTTLQTFLPVHVIIDYLAVGLVVYGVLRFNMVDLDLRLKWTIHKGTIAAAFIAMFFVASEFAKVFFENVAGNVVVGILAAGAVVLFLAPLQRVADRLARTALPHVENSDAYRDYRRFQIYRVALEGILQDGATDPAEARTLRNLRNQLGITQNDHEALEEEVRQTLASPISP